MRCPEGGRPDFPVSNRGVHGYPASYHRWYLEDRGLYWARLLRSMHISWIVLLTDGDSVLERCDVPGWGWTTPLEFFLENLVVPIVRDSTTPLPRPYTNWRAVERAVPIYAKHGMRPLWICRNEPFDSREWASGINPPRPDEAGMSFVCSILQNDMRLVAESGGVPGFPDGPGYRLNPWDFMDLGVWRANGAFYAGHHYGKGREVDHPSNRVAQHGDPYTEAQYRADLDDYAGEPGWMEPPLAEVNAERAARAQEGLTVLQDDVCWRGWGKVWWFAKQHGLEPAMAMTEGGWVVRDRAGSGNDIDERWAYTTPRMVAKKTLAMYKDPSFFFAVCPWLLADDAMSPGGHGVGFYDAAWVGWAHSDRYGQEKPVVKTLQDNPPDSGGTAVRELDLARAASAEAAAAGGRMLARLGG